MPDKEPDMPGARREIKALIVETFGKMEGIEAEPFKFSMHTTSFGSLGYGSSAFVEFKSDQAFWNECYCRKVEDTCVAFKKKFNGIAKAHDIIPGGSAHVSPEMMEKDGYLVCDKWLSERKYAKR